MEYPWLREPEIGAAIWNLTKVMSMQASLPENVRQIAILVTGAHFNAAYEIYSHVAGVEPTGLTAEAEVAYNVTHALVTGRALPERSTRWR